MKISCLLLSVFFIVAGFGHLFAPEMYLEIMPISVPWPRAMVYLSGIAEILGGVGLLLPRTRKAAGLGLIALLVAVFPANVFALTHGMNVGGWQVPVWLLWLRLPLQFVLIAWVYIACWKDPKVSR